MHFAYQILLYVCLLVVKLNLNYTNFHGKQGLYMVFMDCLLLREREKEEKP